MYIYGLWNWILDIFWFNIRVKFFVKHLNHSIKIIAFAGSKIVYSVKFMLSR